MPFHRLCFNMICLLCPARPAMTDDQKYDKWPDLSRWACLIKFWYSDTTLQHIRKSQARAIKCRFRIENRPVFWHIAGKRGKTTLSPSADWVWKCPIRARINLQPFYAIEIRGSRRAAQTLEIRAPPLWRKGAGMADQGMARAGQNDALQNWGRTEHCEDRTPHTVSLRGQTCVWP